MLPDQAMNAEVKETELSLEQRCDRLRGKILEVNTEILGLKGHSVFDGDEDFTGQHNEMLANLTISYRHGEDARMRLGKVMQQIQGGTSIFDRKDQTDEELTRG